MTSRLEERQPEADADDFAITPAPSLVETAVDRLTRAILAHRFAPGERLVETRLAQQLGVSRGPVREALKTLAADGLVEIRKSRGTFVISLSADDFEQMVEVRSVLEGQAARLLAARREPDRLKPLEAVNAELKRAARQNDVSACREIVWRYHATMVRLAGNAFLLQAWQSLGNLVRMFMHSYTVYDTDMKAVLRVHDAFLDVLRAGDPAEAEQVIRSVILFHGFAMIGRAIPPALADYVTRTIKPDGTIAPIRR